MDSVFGDILRDAITQIPHAVGGAFAASDGEAVDGVSNTSEAEWLFITAHHGIILRHLQAALHTFHFGEAETLIIWYRELDVLVHAVADGYYVILAAKHPCHMGVAIKVLIETCERLRAEMG